MRRKKITLRRLCLKCRKPIPVKDPTRDWLCKKCSKENEKIRGPRDCADPFPDIDNTE